MNSKPLRIASISDIHLFHRRTPTEHILDNLDRYFSTDAFLAQVDLVVFVGDVFDDLAAMSHEDVGRVQAWIAKFLRLCYRYQVVVRVLEGTPSHDRNQSQLFETINAIHEHNSRTGIDLKYVRSLSVEHLEAFGIDVLYVPDEWQHDTADTLEDVRQLLQAKGLTQVDYAFMHGQFAYQIPQISKAHIKHDEQAYLKLVKELIFIGHVHKHSQYERILAQGSFDRLAHGEEEAKGFLYVVIEAPQQYQIQFIQNKTAKIYRTFQCRQDELEVSLQYLDRKVQKLPPASYVRVETQSRHPIATGLDVLKRRWPLLIWTIQLKDETTPEASPVLIEEENYVPILINPETITTLVQDRLNALRLAPAISARALSHLSEVI